MRELLIRARDLLRAVQTFSGPYDSACVSCSRHEDLETVRVPPVGFPVISIEIVGTQHHEPDCKLDQLCKDIDAALSDERTRA